MRPEGSSELRELRRIANAVELLVKLLDQYELIRKDQYELIRKEG